MATITDPKEITGLLRAIKDYRDSIVNRCALRLDPLVFVRPGEPRQAEYSGSLLRLPRIPSPDFGFSERRNPPWQGRYLYFGSLRFALGPFILKRPPKSSDYTLSHCTMSDN
jgi:hypothetical protein